LFSTHRISLSEYYKYKYPYMPPLDPASEIIVTSSGTEALFACCQALLDPGDGTP
jgi:aspartate/methionine/tyrosine aminotransferase